MNRKQHYEIYRWTGEWTLFEFLVSCHYLCHKPLFALLFNKEYVHGYILATNVHLLPPCICQLHATFQGIIFSNSTSVLEGTFVEIFLCNLGKSYISEGLCLYSWGFLCLFAMKRDGEQVKVLWRNNLNACVRVFCTQQCLKAAVFASVSVSVNNLYHVYCKNIESFYKDICWSSSYL